MPNDVFERVHNLARQSYAARDLLFQLRNGEPMDNDDESVADPDYDPDGEDCEDDESMSVTDTNYDTENEEPDENKNEQMDVNERNDDSKSTNSSDQEDDVDSESTNSSDQEDDVDSESTNSSDQEDNVVVAPVAVEPGMEELDDSDENAVNEEESVNEVTGVDNNEITGVDQNDTNAETASVETTGNEFDDRYGKREHDYDLRPWKPRSYKHHHADLEDTMMLQLSLLKGLKTFRESGANAVTKELQQIHD
jgi:hypothetical protein